MKDETRGAVARLAAEVVRAACGLDDEESPELDMSAETARIMAMRAKDEIDATRRAFVALEGQLRDTERERDAYREKAERERDALRRHYDAASPEHNLLALLDLYETRRDELEDERNATNAAIAARAESEAALGLLREQWDAMVRERDAYRTRLEHERTKRDFLERELAAYREKAERLSEQMREACEAVGPAWFVTAETTLAEAIQRKCKALEKESSNV